GDDLFGPRLQHPCLGVPAAVEINAGLVAVRCEGEADAVESASLIGLQRLLERRPTIRVCIIAFPAGASREGRFLPASIDQLETPHYPALLRLQCVGDVLRVNRQRNRARRRSIPRCGGAPDGLSRSLHKELVGDDRLTRSTLRRGRQPGGLRY